MARRLRHLPLLLASALAFAGCDTAAVQGPGPTALPATDETSPQPSPTPSPTPPTGQSLTFKGTVGTVAGGASTGNQVYGRENIPATEALLSQPYGVCAAADGTFYFTEGEIVRKVTPSGMLTTVAGIGISGASGDNGPATMAKLNSPKALALDGAGNLYIADTSNHRIRKVSAGTITTLVGSAGGGYGGDGGPAAAAKLLGPEGIAVGSDGLVYVADTSNHRIRRFSEGGLMAAWAGLGESGFAGDLGDARSGKLYAPTALAVDSSGNLYVADTANSRIRKIAPSGVITTVAGSSLSGYSGDGGPATSARLNYPQGVAVDAGGTLYIADTGNHLIRKVAPDGLISTLVGTSSLTLIGAFADGPSSSARLHTPRGLALDGQGRLYIADSGNARIRRLE